MDRGWAVVTSPGEIYRVPERGEIGGAIPHTGVLPYEGLPNVTENDLQ